MDSNQYKIVLVEEGKFLSELKEIRLKISVLGDFNYCKEAVIHLDKILEVINRGNTNNWDILGFTDFRGVYDFKGGLSFLESPLGKKFIDVCFYFAYIYWPKHIGPRL